MKKNSLLILTALVLLLILGYSAHSRTQNNKNVANNQPPKSVTMSDSNDFYTISAMYPADARDTTSAMKQYTESVFNKMKEEWKIGGKVYTYEQNAEKQFPDRPKMTYSSYTTFTSPSSTKLKTTTYVFSTDQFSGGAHDDTRVATFTFGEKGQIKIEDLLNFDKGNDIALTKLLANKILNDYNVSDYTDKKMTDEGLGLSCLDNQGNFSKSLCKSDGFFFPSNFQNFIIRDTGITFIMNRYQVAAGAAGTPQFEITWNELAPYLQANLPIAVTNNPDVD